MKCPYCIKVCTKCGRILVANEMNFFKKKTGKWGLSAECKECRKERNKKYQQSDKGKKAYKKANKKYQQSDKGKKSQKERNRKYNENNPHVAFNNNIKHKHGLNSNITKEQYYEILEYFGYKCAYCGCDLDENNLTLDHVIPLSLGGAVDPWCLVPSCRSCNSSKHASEMLLWLNTKEMIDIEKLEKIEKIYSWCEFAFDKYNDN